MNHESDSHSWKDPKTLGQLAAWLQNMPLSSIQDNGFFIMLMAGHTLFVPPGYVVTEACIGTDGAAMLSYPTLLKSQMESWRGLWQDVKLVLNPNNESQMNVRAAMNLVDRLLMLGCVKTEADDDADFDDDQRTNAKSSNSTGKEQVTDSCSKAEAPC